MSVQKINVLGGYVGLDGEVHPAKNSLANVLSPRKKTEEEFMREKRERQIREAFPTGFRRYRVKNYEKGEFPNVKL
jgi:hypothetical protein